MAPRPPRPLHSSGSGARLFSKAFTRCGVKSSPTWETPRIVAPAQIWNDTAGTLAVSRSQPARAFIPLGPHSLACEVASEKIREFLTSPLRRILCPDLAGFARPVMLTLRDRATQEAPDTLDHNDTSSPEWRDPGWDTGPRRCLARTGELRSIYAL